MRPSAGLKTRELEKKANIEKRLDNIEDADENAPDLTKRVEDLEARVEDEARRGQPTYGGIGTSEPEVPRYQQQALVVIWSATPATPAIAADRDVLQKRQLAHQEASSPIGPAISVSALPCRRCACQAPRRFRENARE